MALTAKQEQYCQEYLIDLNQTQAAIRAGYSQDSARSEASRLMTNVNIRTRIKELMDIRSANVLVDQGFVIENLIAISQKCQQAKPVEVWDYEEKQMVQTGEYVFDSQGANKAVELIGKHLGMFKDKVEHSGTIENPKAAIVKLPNGSELEI